MKKSPRDEAPGYLHLDLKQVKEPKTSKADAVPLDSFESQSDQAMINQLLENHSLFINTMRKRQEKTKSVSKWWMNKDMTSVINALNMM